MTVASGVQWGDVSAWVGSVLTGVSLILAFTILLRDRRMEEREQARRIITSTRLSMRSGRDAGDDLTLYVENSSDRPIRLMALIAEGRPVKEVIADLRQAGGDQQDLIATLEKTKEIGPLLHEGWLDRSTDSDYSIDELKPGERRSLMIKYTEFPPICYKVDFSFTDANGMYWRKDVNSGRGRMLSANELGPTRFSKLRRWSKRRLGMRL